MRLFRLLGSTLIAIMLTATFGASADATSPMAESSPMSDECRSATNGNWPQRAAPQTFRNHVEAQRAHNAAWLTSARAQEGVRLLNSEMDQFGTAIFGMTPSSSHETMLVVVDVSEQDHRHEIEEHLDRLTLPFATQVTISCYSKADLASIQQTLASGPEATGFQGSSSTFIDTLLGKVVLVLANPSDSELKAVRSDLNTRYGERVHVTAGSGISLGIGAMPHPNENHNPPQQVQAQQLAHRILLRLISLSTALAEAR